MTGLGATQAVCIECETTFPSQRAVGVHARVHGFVQCPICQRAYSQIRKHMFEEHNGWLPRGWSAADFRKAVLHAVAQEQVRLSDVLMNVLREEAERPWE